MTVPLIEALRLGFGFLGFFTGAATGLPFMKFPFLPLPFLKLVVLLTINTCVSVLGTGVPRLACLRPAAWLKWGPNATQLHQLKLKTLARGQASWGRRQEASSGEASLGRLARRRRDQGRVPPEEPVTQSMTIETRRAPACAVSLFPIRCKGGKHRPRH